MRESKPKGDVSHQQHPGKGKTGRGNASESSVRLRNLKLPDTMTDQDGNAGAEAWRLVPMVQWPAIPTRRREGHHAPGV